MRPLATRYVFMVLVALFFLLAAADRHGLWAQSALSDSEKAERRAANRRAVEAESTRLARERVADEGSFKAWMINVSANVGHDDNVTLDSQRKGDIFHQETMTFSLALDHPGIGFFGREGKWGFDAGLDNLNYSKQNQADYINSKVNPFVTLGLTPTLSLKTEYGLESVRYPEDDHISFYNHDLKLSLVQSRFASWIHTLFAIAQRKDFTDRKALSAFNTDLGSRRADYYYEGGYSVNYSPIPKTAIGFTASYKLNDSNDVYIDYSDYRGAKTSGYLYAELAKRLNWMGAAGYDYKKYSGKVFEAASSETERDGFIYAASYFFYELGPKTQLVLSYLFAQNMSNDPLYDYTGHVITAGVTVSV